MIPEDYNHPLFAATNTSELKRHLDALYETYEPTDSNQAFRIFYRLQELGKVCKGLRMDTKYGVGSCFYRKADNDVMRVRFDGDISSTGISPSSIRTFWFEMD